MVANCGAVAETCYSPGMRPAIDHAPLLSALTDLATPLAEVATILACGITAPVSSVATPLKSGG